MKKLFFILLFVPVALFGQITPDMFVQPANTGANMTVGFNASKFDQFEGGQIGAFYDLNGDGTLQCVGLETIAIGFFGLALWGDDSSCPEGGCGYYPGSVSEFAVLHEGNVIMVAEIPQFTGYVTNGIVNITDANLSMTGCSDTSACNTMTSYSGVNYLDDGSCWYEDNIYNCDGCINDSDGDGVCDELEVLGCMNNDYIEYNSNATDDDGSCNELIVLGCTDSLYVEYNLEANIDDGTCEELIVLGCTDSLYLEYWNYGEYKITLPNPIPNTDDGSCEELIVYGCVHPWGATYNPYANIYDGSCEFSSIDEYNDFIHQLNPPIYHTFNEGWTMFGYSCSTSNSIESSLDPISYSLIILKNNDGQIYYPEYGFNGIGDFIPGGGYLIKVEYTIPYFSFCNGIRIFNHEGCSDPSALNYNQWVNVDNGTCNYD